MRYENINFKKDSVFEVFREYCEYENRLFTFIGEGASKMVYEFYEESTDKIYVFKIEKKYYYEQLPFIKSDSEDYYSDDDYFVTGCCDKQIQKEIQVFKFLENNKDIKHLFAPIVLEQSSEDDLYETMIKCNAIVDCYDDVHLFDELFSKLKETSIDEIFDGILKDFRFSNVGILDGRAVMIDYGFGEASNWGV